MKKNYFFIVIAFLMGISFFRANAQVLPGTYTTSWAGNTIVPTVNDGYCVQGWANSMFVDTDGTIYANCFWDEAARELGVYKNGQATGLIPNQHAHADGGAITANSTYIWATVHEGKISRFNKAGYAENGTEFLVSTATLRGLTASATELFVSDYANNKIKVYSAATQGSLLRSWSVTRPGPLAMDASGNVWVLTYDANAYGPGTGACVKAYSSTGTLLKTITLAAGVQAKSITIDKTNNELLVTDISDNMQVQIYNNINATPAFAQSFGIQGGILSGTKGVVAPLKLNVPNLVGVDASHNLIIWSNGNNPDIDKLEDADGMGSCVESYTRAGVLNWQMLGLHFVDMGTFDPSTDGADLYTKHEHFTMDYSKPDGQQWTFKGWTLDRKKFPNDARCHNDGGHLASTFMKRINGKLFMYMTAMASDGWWIYRFDNTNEGETAIPCGIVTQWENLWIDNNGNGQADAGENSSAINIPQEEFFGRCVDNNGTIWFARTTAGIYNFPIQSVNSYGVPVYSATSASVVTMPAPFTDVRRIYYDTENDAMYLSGYTSTQKNTTNDWGAAGKVMCRYNNWSTGNRTASFTTLLPFNTTTNETAVSMTVEKDYIFVCGVASRGLVWVYSATTGVLVGTMTPGANVGGVAKTGWCDLRNSIAAFKKSNGEYLVTVEEDGWEKVLIYRWNTGVTNVAVTGVSLSPTTASINVAATQQLTATVAPSNATNKNVTWSSSNTAIATVNSSGLVTGVSAGTATITVTTVDGAKTATCAVTVTASTGTWTTIENTNAGWTWSGFSLDACTSCSGGSSHSTGVVNSYGQITFTGTDVELYCENWIGAGSAEVFIDGVSKGIFTQSGLSKWATISGLTNTSHVLKVVAKDVNWPSVDYIKYYSSSVVVAVTGVSVSPTTASISVAATQQLTATIAPANATNTSVTWSSSNTAVATVNASGLVTGVAAGTATITVTTVDGAKTATCNVTVTAGFNHVYNFAGINAANADYNVFECDVDVFPFAGVTANRNSMVEATDAKYSNISAIDANEWLTVDPGTSDEIFIWAEMKIIEPALSINQIDLTINGYTNLGSTTSIYVLKAGQAWEASASWVKVGIDQSIPAVNTTMTRSITANISDYIDASGKITWGIYETRSSEAMHVNYIELVAKSSVLKSAQSITEIASVVENSVVDNVKIYPNPTSDYVTIDFNNGLNDDKLTVELINIMGKKVYESGVLNQTNSLQIPVAQFAKGIYIVVVTSGTDRVNKKLIIR